MLRGFPQHFQAALDQTHCFKLLGRSNRFDLVCFDRAAFAALFARFVAGQQEPQRKPTGAPGSTGRERIIAKWEMSTWWPILLLKLAVTAVIWKITVFIGKPSIAMGHIYHGKLLVITTRPSRDEAPPGSHWRKLIP